MDHPMFGTIGRTDRMMGLGSEYREQRLRQEMDCSMRTGGLMFLGRYLSHQEKVRDSVENIGRWGWQWREKQKKRGACGDSFKSGELNVEIEVRRDGLTFKKEKIGIKVPQEGEPQSLASHNNPVDIPFLPFF